MAPRRSFHLILIGLLCIAFVGCVGVRARRGKPQQSGFLGDYSKLEHREGFPAQEVWINPDAVWSKYDSVQLESVTMWVNKETGALTDEEKQMLTDLLFKALHAKLGSQFTLVDRPGPRTLRVRAALTQAKGSNVAVRTISTIIPQSLILGAAVGMSADTAKTVGSGTIEVEVVDSVTQERLGAAVDSRAGTKSLVSLRTFEKWGDVEAAANFWAYRLTRGLIRMGVRRKPDATELEVES